MKSNIFDRWIIVRCFSDADFKLAPFFDGYDRRRLDEHEKDLNVISHFSFVSIC